MKVTSITQGQMIETSTGEMFLRVGGREWFGIVGGYWKLLIFDHDLEMAYQDKREDIWQGTLTLDKLKAFDSHTVFAKGYIYTEMGVNIPAFKFVAKRGLIDDWAMYFDSVDKSWKEVEQGTKMRDEAAIKKTISCSKEVFERYRL